MSKQSDLVNITQGDADINGGTIDGTVIGATTPAAISGTSGQFDTSLNVDGPITSDGLTVGASNGLVLDTSGVTEASWTHNIVTGESTISVGRNAGWGGDLNIETDTLRRMRIQNSGDISFYEDTGTTPKFFWDASAESLGIGTSSPSRKLHVSSSQQTISLLQTSSSVGQIDIQNATATASLAADGADMYFYVNSGERMRIDSSGNTIIKSGGELRLNRPDDATYGAISHGVAGTGIVYNDVNGDGHHWQLAGSEKMRIDSSGNVGVGTGSASALGKFDSYSTTVGSNGWYMAGNFGAPQYPMVRLYAATPGKVSSLGNNGDGSLYFYVNGSTSDIGTYAGQFDSSGNLLVGMTGTTTSVTYGGIYLRGDSNAGGTNDYAQLFVQHNSSYNHGIVIKELGSSGYAVRFMNNVGTIVGSISTTASSTAYVTSSDYRMKENVVPLLGAADRLAKIPVHRFNFIADPDTTVDGFIAHEVQEIVPEAITGTKDEVDDEGNPVYQGIDQSKLVPLLTAALQEALARIETLEARMAALET